MVEQVVYVQRDIFCIQNIAQSLNLLFLNREVALGEHGSMKILILISQEKMCFPVCIEIWGKYYINLELNGDILAGFCELRSYCLFVCLFFAFISQN